MEKRKKKRKEGGKGGTGMGQRRVELREFSPSQMMPFTRLKKLETCQNNKS